MAGPRGTTLAVVSAKYPYGPRESYLHAELAGLARHCDRVIVAPVSPDRSATIRENPYERIDVPLTAGSTAAAALREALRHPLRAVRVVAETLFDRRTPPKVALKNAAVLPYAFALAGRLRAASVDHIHAYWFSTPATVAFVVSRLTGIPFSATAHRWDVYEPNLAARKAAAASALRAISHRGARDLRARIAAADRDKVRVVRVGVALDGRVAPSTLTAGTLRVLCAANLVEVKGHRDLIDALARVRDAGIDVQALFAGDGPLRASLERRVAECSLGSRVRFAGVVPHDGLLDALARGDFDVAVLASIERPGGEMEGVPVALIEALALGVPCVGSDSGSIPELLGGGNGVVVPQSDPGALAAALIALARDPARRAALGARGRAHVRAVFDRDATARRLAVHVGCKIQALTTLDLIDPGTVQAPAVG